MSMPTSNPMPLRLYFIRHLITLLDRNDPASVERLTEVYLACRKSLRGG